MRYLMCLTLVLLFALNVASLTTAQETLEITPELQAQIDEIEQLTSDLRGLDALQPIERRFPTREEVRAYLQTALDSSLPPGEIERYIQFYAAFDLLPPDIDLRGVYLELLGSQVAGYYDPETKQMNTIMLSGEIPEDELPLLEQTIYAHEFTHALQDQHFDLRAIGIDPSTPVEEFDRTIAVSSLIEGDATLAMTLYLQQATADNPLAALSILTQSLQSGSLAMPAGTPSILVDELLFPYNNGLTFVSELYASGGWLAVNEAYVNLPQSSEHILHPERYLEGDMPQDVQLQSTQEVLGEDWELIWDTRLGEFYLQSYLKTQLPISQAVRAAAGWGGDNFNIYRDADGESLAWVMRLAWDTPQDADEFAEAFTAFGGARYEDAAPSDGCWSNADDALCFVDEEGQSLISFAPTLELAQTLRDSQQG
jgi:hypothetical protein